MEKLHLDRSPSSEVGWIFPDQHNDRRGELFRAKEKGYCYFQKSVFHFEKNHFFGSKCRKVNLGSHFLTSQISHIWKNWNYNIRSSFCILTKYALLIFYRKRPKIAKVTSKHHISSENVMLDPLTRVLIAYFGYLSDCAAHLLFRMAFWIQPGVVINRMRGLYYIRFCRLFWICFFMKWS